MKFHKIVSLVVLTTAVSACQQHAPNNQLLIFLNKEKGLKPYQTRIIVTPTLMRLDDGEGSKNYTIFDRKTRIARSVDNQQHTVLIINPKSIKVDPPFKLHDVDKDMGEMKGAPKVMGKVPRYYKEYTNNKLCNNLIAVKGLMPEAVKAIAEYREMLASDSMMTVNDMPADMQDPCALSRNTFAPTRYLQHGFPIQQWRPARSGSPGYSRMLVNYKEQYQPDPKLFEIPQGYFTYTVQQIRDGLVDLDNRKILSPATPKKQKAK